MFSFKTTVVGAVITLQRIDQNNVVTSIGTVPVNAILKIQRTGTDIKFIYPLAGVSTTATISGISNNSIALYTGFGANATIINNLKIVKETPGSLKDIVNQVQVSVIKNNGNYKPKIAVTKYSKEANNPTAVVTTNSFEYASPSLISAQSL